MKPVYLEISAFGPYAGKEVLDFRELDHTSPFLICGDTGAGKTSIFDALSYVLFDKSSGSERQIENFRSHFADEDTPSYVRLFFKQKGQYYELTRCLPYRRRRIRGEGWRNVPASAELRYHYDSMPDERCLRGECDKADPDAEIITRKTEVDERVKEIIGMNVDEFRMTSMIAQGQFTKLLKSSSSERSIIMRDLFRTGQYADFSRALKERFQERSTELRELERDKLRLIGEHDWIESAPDEFYKSEEGEASLLTQCQKRLEACREEEKTAKKKKHEADEARKEAERIFYEGEALAERFGEREQKQAALNALELRREEIEAFREELRRAETAERLRPEAEREEAARKNLLEDQEELSRLREEILRLKECRQKLAAEAEEKAEAWASIPKDEQKIKGLEAQLPHYEELEKRQKELRTRQAELRNLSDREDKLLSRIEQKEKRKAELRKAADEAHNPEADVLKTSFSLKELEKKIADLDELEEKAGKLSLLLERAGEAGLAYEKAKAAWTVKREHFELLERVFLNNQAVLLAAELKDQTPCPVCGSTEHPKPAESSGGQVSQEDWAEARRISDEASKIERKAYESFSKLQTDIKAQAENLSSFYPDNPLAGGRLNKAKLEDWLKRPRCLRAELDSRRNEENLRLSELKQSLSRWQLNKKELSELEPELESLAEERKKTAEAKNLAEREFVSLESRLEESRRSLSFEDLAACRKEISRRSALLEADKQSLSAFEEKKRKNDADLSKAEGALQTAEAHCRSSETALGKAEDLFREALSKAGFGDADRYREALRPAKRQQELAEAVKQYEIEIEHLTKLLEDLEKKLENKSKPDLGRLGEMRRAAEKRCEEAAQAFADVRRAGDMAEKLGKILDSLFTKIAEVRKEYLFFSEVSKLAGGNMPGVRNVTFEQYVQGFYFKYILHLAGKHLMDMSEGRYYLRHREEATKGRQQEGLEIDVLDTHTGMSRPVHTLSGGETFMTSLALALGLSDTVRSMKGGLEVDILFIDEGFESLDSDSLQNAADTINSLADRNCLIGVISHVRELKDKIHQKIHIEKTNKGSHISQSISGTML